MKKTKLLLTMAAIAFATMICCSISAFALTEGDWEFKLLDNQVTISKYIGENEDIVVPKTIAGCPVTKIEAHAFNKNIVSITFHDMIKEIPSFSYHSKLETVVLPEGIEIIPDSAFLECKSLKNINIPSTVKTIGFQAFKSCTSLTSITLPDGIESIGTKAFKWTGLKEIDLSNVKNSYGERAFYYCDKLETVKLSPSVAEIPGEMFRGCNSLKNVEIPSGVTSIGNYAFVDCVSLEEIILPSSLKYLGGAFTNTAIKQIVVPYGTETINGVYSSPFGKCKNLEAVFIPETVNKIYMGNLVNGSPEAIVYCSADSYTSKYCNDNGISYLTDNSVNSGIHVYYNGKRISFHSYAQNPEILEGRTLVPLRSIFEEMGAVVEWDGATSTAIAKRGNIEVKITIGANEIYKNGEPISVDVPAMLMNNRTMVPARVVAEAFGADVQWNSNGRAVLITE